LRLRLARRGERTSIVKRYTKAPFGSVRANYPDSSGIPEVQITNPSGGILGGDLLEMEITIGPSAAATVLTQAANKAYRGAEALQRSTFRVEEGAFLEYLPHHLIPFAGSNYRQEHTFHVAEGATLITWDACSAGRVARGERFAFSTLFGRTRISSGDIPCVVDGFDLSGVDPSDREPFGGYSYLGTLYVLALEELSPLAEELHALLGSTSRVLASASVPETRLCAVRILAWAATALSRALNGCRVAARTYLNVPPPAREVW